MFKKAYFALVCIEEVGTLLNNVLSVTSWGICFFKLLSASEDTFARVWKISVGDNPNVSCQKTILIVSKIMGCTWNIAAIPNAISSFLLLSEGSLMHKVAFALFPWVSLSKTFQRRG